MTTIEPLAVDRFESRAMASPLRLTVVGADGGLAARAWASVRDEFESCEQAMSRFRDASEVTLLNRAGAAGRGMTVGRRLRRALAAADRARRLTRGRFDPRVLRQLDRLGYRGAALDEPSSGGHDSTGAAAEAAGVVQTRRERPIVQAEGRRDRRLREPVDLGGIGKGLALRWAAARARRDLGPTPGLLLEAGGDLVAAGPAPDDGPWLIGVEDPAGGSAPLAVISLRHGAIATSSVLVNRWTGPSGAPVHHLVDPATGEPGGEGLAAVTVMGPDPAWAEVRTKELFLAGERLIGPLARSYGLAAWWVTSDGRLEMTPGGRLATAWTMDLAAG